MARTGWKGSLGLAAASALLGLTCVEVSFRALRFDFAFQRSAFERTPIYGRQPVLPVGDVFFRRPGPAHWEGQVLTHWLREAGVPRALWPEEPPIGVDYDALGFRNPENLSDWEIAVVGDSFTEAGYLPYSDLFTTRLGEHLGVRVKNLGVSYTGPLTYLYYLEHYARGPSTRHAVMAFYEGNDVMNAIEEASRISEEEERRRRDPAPRRRVPPLETLEPQSSFLKALHAWWKHRTRSFSVDSYYVRADPRVPVTVWWLPPDPDELGSETQSLLRDALVRFAQVSKRLGMTPWLLYLPAKRRALDGYLEFEPEADPRIAAWKPSGLPAWMRAECDRLGVRFVDATPALRAEAAAGRLPYNALIDTHLNRHGSHVVGRALADAMEPAVRGNEGA